MRWTGPVPRTTWVAGLCLGVAALLELVLAARVVIPVTETFLVPIQGPWLSVPAALLQAAGLVVLALGLKGEPAAIGGSRAGRGLLLVFAAQQPVGASIGLLPVEGGPIVAVSAVLGLVFLVSGVLAGLIVSRAGILRGAARWTVLALALALPAVSVLFLLLLSFRDVRALEAANTLLLAPLEFLYPLVLLLAASTLLLHGRTAAVRERLASIRAAW